MVRLREGRAATVRGAAHFLRETIGRVRAAGASGELTLRADSGFYAAEVVAVCRRMDVRFSITLRMHGSMRARIAAIPEDAWTPIPYWLDGGADVAEISYVPFAERKDARPVRLIVRRVRPTPGSQLALFTLYDYHPLVTDRAGETLELEADHRRHAEIENAIRDLKYDLGIAPLTAAAAADLLELIEDRHDRRSTIVTSQLPVAHWHEALGEPTIADAILDRLVHNAYRIELRGDSLRRRDIAPDGSRPASAPLGAPTAEKRPAQMTQDAR